MDEIVYSYYKNDAKKLHTLVDQILFKQKFNNINKDDFYSLANEVFYEVMTGFDGSRSFDGYLYSCLTNSFKEEMRDRNRQKRRAYMKVEVEDEHGNVKIITKPVFDESINRNIGDDENSTIADLIASDFSVEKEVFGGEEIWSKEVQDFLNSLSPLQRKIAIAISEEKSVKTICRELHITQNHYANSVRRMFSNEKIKPLRELVEKRGGN